MTSEPLDCAFSLGPNDGEAGNCHREARGRFDEVAQNHRAANIRP
jgi:hypothetical protein